MWSLKNLSVEQLNKKLVVMCLIDVIKISHKKKC